LEANSLFSPRDDYHKTAAATVATLAPLVAVLPLVSPVCGGSHRVSAELLQDLFFSMSRELARRLVL